MLRAESHGPRRERRLAGRLRRGALVALLLHAQILGPLVILTFIYAAREEAERADEVDVAFRDVDPEELPKDLPSLDDLTARDELPPPRPPKPRDRLKKRPPALAKETPPEPEVRIPPLPPMPPEKKEEPPPPDRHNKQKMVDLDNDKEIEPPPDAKFLAQKNNKAEVETRATDTNLKQAQKGEEASAEKSKRQDDQLGDDKAKIADLDEQKSREGRKAPEVTPHENPQVTRPQPEPPKPKSLLALRDPSPRQHEITPETADPSLPRTADGRLAKPSDRARHQHEDDMTAAPARDKRVRLQLTGSDFEYLFGADAEAERRLAQTQRSKKQGKFQQRLGRLQSALENFIPEVQPGNQTALNTRAAPFAAYIARMHRSIHRLWGFGMLEDWDEKPGASPFNNPDLLTTLEMVLNGDGSVDKITIVRASGYLPYDAAAIDVAYSAGPFPDPPRAIRSKNGKIYVHWRFYRDGRQCATSGADYFILDNPPPGGDVAAVNEPAERNEERSSAGANGMGVGGGGAEEGPRRLERRTGGGSGSGRVAHNHAAEAAGLGPEEGESSKPTPSNVPRPENPAARLVAEAWFVALGRGDIASMLGRAAFPFRSSDGVEVSSRDELRGMLKSLIDEAPAAERGSRIQIYTTAGLRGALGRMPPGLDDGSGMLFAVSAPSASETFILALAQKPGGWKAVGLVRR
ncbi:MAG TPA: TonB family protein [Polyangia bacterium]|jgi:TonB family protein|nr:TonB family protein [Polyangia bacterium]